MSNSLGFSSSRGGVAPRAPMKPIQIEAETKSRVGGGGGKDTDENRLKMKYLACKCFLDMAWAFTTIIGIYVFSMPKESLQGATSITVTSDSVYASSLIVTKQLAVVLMRTLSVFILLCATSIPCPWSVTSRILSWVSLTTALTYYSVLLGDDNFFIIDKWFGITFLIIALIIPWLFMSSHVMYLIYRDVITYMKTLK